MGDPAFLFCSRCGTNYDPNKLLNLCECGGPLLVRYPLPALKETWSRDSLARAEASMWRYAPVLPAPAADAVTLGEGWTPLLHTGRLGAELAANDLWVKDEEQNPGGSFKARGLGCAVTMAKRFGVTKLAIPSAGNAGGALAQYAAEAGIAAHVFMPRDVPQSNFLECKAYGANVTLLDGLISDCGRLVAERTRSEDWFEVSTLKEPYRIEGKKTMGYEIAEQFVWQLPDVIIYPCGGGVGLIGIWKAIGELAELGWIGPKRPRMVAVQAAGCAPIVRAWDEKKTQSEMWPDAHTVASGLRVPKALGDALVLQALRESEGTALSVTDEEMMEGALLLARTEGIFAAPESGACVAAVPHLLRSGFLKANERVVLLSTGSGLKYAEAFATRFPRHIASEQDKLGGLITPR